MATLVTATRDLRLPFSDSTQFEQGALVSKNLENFQYDDAIVRKFLLATILWGIAGMLVGLAVATQLANPLFNLDGLTRILTFGRIRPLHTNLLMFAFAGNALFCGIYYSLQRLLKARLYSDVLSQLHFWGWQFVILAAAVSLPLGITQGKEYAELEWPIDIAMAVVWVIFAGNLFGTIARRRMRHLYVSIWFYIATVISVAGLHIVSSLAVPATATRSYSWFAGWQDAMVQWWYGHSIVTFLLTVPFLGLMYYFLPKAAGRPVFSYKLAILHFWTLLFLSGGAGPQHLHYTALPPWLSSLGMLCSVMLWMPSWGGLINGLLTLRGAWHRVSEDPALKFMVLGVIFYGISTFEAVILGIKSVNSLANYTDWTIAHRHLGGMGWVGFFTFGMIYWLLPRVFQAPVYSQRLVGWHFWFAILGLLLFVVPTCAAGLTQGLMWREFGKDGGLAYEFVETVTQLVPLYCIRGVGGVLYLTGALLCLVNVVRTWLARPSTYQSVTDQAAALSAKYTEPDAPPTDLELSSAHVIPFAYKIDRLFRAAWHRRWEGMPLRFSLLVGATVAVASLVAFLPILASSWRANPDLMRPYTPLELAGRDLYVSEGCHNCHTQMVRPIWAETQRYGAFSRAEEFVHDRPFQWGSRRIGPDLHRVGGKYKHVWHVNHLRNPRDEVSTSLMPGYAWLLEENLDYADLKRSVRGMLRAGVPYDDGTLGGFEVLARAQAREIAAQIAADDGPPGLESRKVVALIAYLQRLGTDLPESEPGAASPGTGGVK